MTALAEARKAARLGLNPYNDWVAREGINVVEGVGHYLPGVETKPWPRYGVKGALVHLTGKGEWSETTDVTAGGNPPHHSVEMLLQHQP